MIIWDHTLIQIFVWFSKIKMEFILFNCYCCYFSTLTILGWLGAKKIVMSLLKNFERICSNILIVTYLKFINLASFLYIFIFKCCGIKQVVGNKEFEHQTHAFTTHSLCVWSTLPHFGGYVIWHALIALDICHDAIFWYMKMCVYINFGILFSTKISNGKMRCKC